jgi:hypothetical protein
MLAGFDLDPIGRASATTAAISALGHKPLKPHEAGVPEQVGANLSLLKVTQEDAIHSPREEPSQARLSHRERQIPDIVTVANEHVEGVELNLLVVLARGRPLKSDPPSTPSSTASPSITKELWRFLSAASAMSGKRWLQSCPLRVNSRTRLPSR